MLFSQRIGVDNRIRAVAAEGGDPWDMVAARASLGPAQFSSTGSWIVYESAESGEAEIYAARFSATRGALAGRRIKVSAAGGSEPRWRRDGKEILYLAPAGRMTAVEVRIVDAVLEHRDERTLFTMPGIMAWDVTANGERFLASVENEQ